MRRFIPIFIIIVIVAAIVLGGLWLSARKTATENGSNPLSFREFVTGSSSSGTVSPDDPGSLSSDFTTDGSGTTTDTPTGQTPSQTSWSGSLTPSETQVSVFTDETLSPTTSPSGTNTNGPGTTPSTPNTTPTTPNTTPIGTGPGTTTTTPTTPGTSNPGSNPTPPPPTRSTPLPQCSDADLNIIFTPQELADLKTLERRFYTIAESIRTDEDVAREVSNHDTFDIKGVQLQELLTYCLNKTPQLANPLYKKRVATPFWNNSSTDTLGFVTDSIETFQPIVNLNDFGYGKGRLVKALRLNLW